MSENALLNESTPLIQRAVALLDDTVEVLATPELWCRGAFAKDASGTPIGGSIVEAVESE